MDLSHSFPFLDDDRLPLIAPEALQSASLRVFCRKTFFLSGISGYRTSFIRFFFYVVATGGVRRSRRVRKKKKDQEERKEQKKNERRTLNEQRRHAHPENSFCYENSARENSSPREVSSVDIKNIKAGERKEK